MSTQAITTLKEAARKANAALSDAEADIREKENAAHVGKTFRYRNNYSCPEKPGDYWWLYTKVLRVSRFELICFEFQTDKNGDVHINFRHHAYPSLIGRHQQIPAREFKQAWRRLQKRIAEYQP